MDQEEASVPTYDEAFPSLPELDEERKAGAEARKGVWAAEAIKPSQTTQVSRRDGWRDGKEKERE